MKKSIAALAIVGLLAAGAAAYGPGKSGGPGFGGGPGNCPGYAAGGSGAMQRGGGQGNQAAQIDAETAQKAIAAYAEQNLTGFELGEVQGVQMPRGTMYGAYASDDKGNEFFLRVNRWGQVRGPFPVQ